MTVTPVSDEVIEAAIKIIGTAGISEDDIERKVRGLVADDMTSRRIVDWIPEAFGIVFVSHLSSEITLPKTFSAKCRNGSWTEVALTREPIFTSALLLAQKMFHSGPREVFQGVSTRSSMVDCVNKALNSGSSLEGASLSGPALIGIPAEVYVPQPKSLFQRLFSR